MFNIDGESYKYKVPFEVNIRSMDNDYCRFAYSLNFVKETSKSIYAKSPFYGWTYRIEKNTSKVFLDGKQIANTCDYTVLHYYTNEETEE